MIRHCSEQAEQLMRSAQGADLVCTLCCGDLLAAAARDSESAAIGELHRAVAVALVPPAGATQDDKPASDSVAQSEGGAVEAAASKPAVAKAAPVPLLEDFFASRALCRSLRSAAGAHACEAFCAVLWADAFKSRCAHVISGHGAKVLAALHAACSAATRAEVEGELASCVDDLTVWAHTFMPKARKKAMTSADKVSACADCDTL